MTDKDREACREKVASLRSEGIYMPPSLEGAVAVPGNAGGLNWSGMSFDPVRQLLIANTNNLPFLVKLIPRYEYNAMRETGAVNRLKGDFWRQTGAPYAMYREPLMSLSGTHCIAPPWGKPTAVDLNTGEIRWEAALGRIPQLALFPKSAEFGSINFGGSMVTAGGLVFIAAAMDDKLRAFDIETGKVIWEGQLPASANDLLREWQAIRRNLRRRARQSGHEEGRSRGGFHPALR